MPTAARSPPSRSRRTPRRSGRHLPVDDPAIYPVSGGSRGHRDGAQARPGLPPRPRRDRALDRHRPVGELPRQHARGARPVGSRAAPPAVRGLARPVPPCQRRLSVPRRRAGRPRPGRRRGARGGARADDRGGRSRDGRRVRRRADRRRDPGGGRAAGRLLAGHRGGLPPSRRAAHRRRGHDRVRPDRPLVRVRPLGRPARHPRRGQGRHLRLLAVRLRGDVRRGAPDGHRRRRVRPRLHVQPLTGGRRGRPRGAPDPGGRGSRRGERGQGRAAARTPGDPPGRSPERRRDPRPRADGRPGARRRPDVAGGRPTCRPAHGSRRPDGPRRGASSSTRGPATRTA